ncbi:DNA polymerase epsilon catalytic subunit A [Dissostichus eleginoides]|uniref:DNA polymerase epsilon catalytic subunit A n=1 Tax=Dissostichus eleginoides TaxID=100907 RepID=A0AAD9BU60_DISEL|nr:DNA polymerase epsilon catalytic subunit A [Dissostichus eleginoides]
MDELKRIKMSSLLILLLQFTVTEHQVNDEVTLRCSVTRSGRRRLKVKWLLQGQDVDKDNSDIKTSQSYCSASVRYDVDDGTVNYENIRPPDGV